MTMNKAKARDLALRLERKGFSPIVAEDPDEVIGTVCYAYTVTVACAACEATAINGVACHEAGCPNALPFDCWECGCNPVKRERALCDDCYQSGYADA